MNLVCVDFILSLSWRMCLHEKTLLYYTNWFSRNDYKVIDKIIYKYCKDKYGRRSKS